MLVVGAILVGLVLVYFVFGIALKFFIAWWILLLGAPVLLGIGLTYDWPGAIFAIGGFSILIRANNSWSGSTTYLKIENYVDVIFHLT